MPRPLVVVAALLLLAVGCKRRAHDDARAPAPRSSSAAPLSCRALESCTDSCADAACAEACVRRLTTIARPAYDALQACVVPACTDPDGGTAPCRAPGSFACKMCVLSRCASQAAACMSR
ncbi:MAG: hypothetical protein LC659_11205 [Myxococcales bacterium]|nr:hypothetical protein [Myxococcales bacterium]